MSTWSSALEIQKRESCYITSLLSLLLAILVNVRVFSSRTVLPSGSANSSAAVFGGQIVLVLGPGDPESPVRDSWSTVDYQQRASDIVFRSFGYGRRNTLVS